MGRYDRDHSDRVADEAIGHVNKEWRQMAKLALHLRTHQCNPEWAEEQESKFTGIYSRLLTDSIEELEVEAGRSQYA